MSVPSSIRVLVAAPRASLTAQIASAVRDAGFDVAGERPRVDRPAALDGIDVLVVAAETAVAPQAIPGGGPGVVVIGADPAMLELFAHDRARAVGVVPADADVRTIGAAIAAVAAGLSVRPPDPTIGDAPGEFRPAAGRRNTPDGNDHPLDAEPLTPREAEVLESLAQGLSNRAIAARMEISEHTVKFHLAAIFGKLGVRTRTSAVRRALRRGLIDL